MNGIKRSKCFLLFLSAGLMVAGALLHASPAHAEGKKTPSLLIMSHPVPESLKDKLYSKPVQVEEITPSEVIGRDDYARDGQTLVSKKIRGLGSHLSDVQGKLENITTQLNNYQRLNEQKASEYYAAVATINTQLQAGTTPGNPRLVSKINVAEKNLEALSNSLPELNKTAIETAHIGSEASFLLEEARAAYNLSGAFEEDHVRLAKLEDRINSTLVAIDRVLNTVNDDLTRTSAYVSSERDNLRTLSLGVTKGDLYGKSLTRRPFSSAQRFQSAEPEPTTREPGVAVSSPQTLQGPRPLVKIKFDRPDVDFEQPVYVAINEALERYPDARFDLVAVHPTIGNAAQVAIESTRARRNAERVLRVLTQMGLPLEKIDLSYEESDTAVTNEVHIYIR